MCEKRNGTGKVFIQNDGGLNYQAYCKCRSNAAVLSHYSESKRKPQNSVIMKTPRGIKVF